MVRIGRPNEVRGYSSEPRCKIDPAARAPVLVAVDGFQKERKWSKDGAFRSEGETG